MHGLLVHLARGAVGEQGFSDLRHNRESGSGRSSERYPIECEHRPADIEDKSCEPGAKSVFVFYVLFPFIQKRNDTQTDSQERHHNGESQKG